MTTHYIIRVKGHLGAHWSQWFDGLIIVNEPNGEGVLSGALPDQAALFGVLARVQGLGLALIEVRGVESDAPEAGAYDEQETNHNDATD